MDSVPTTHWMTTTDSTDMERTPVAGTDVVGLQGLTCDEESEPEQNQYALRKHIVGESEHLSKSVFECFSPWFAEELTA